MATLILRPTSDISLGHTCSSGSSGYAMLNEETADDGSTYIQQTISSGSTSSKTSSFKFTTAMPVSKLKITAIKAYVRATSTSSSRYDNYSLNYTVSINGKTSSSQSMNLSSSYSTNSVSLSTSTFNLSDVEINNLNNLNFQMSITTSGYRDKNKFYIRITQIYLEITYEEIITQKLYLKVNGVYQPVQKVYKKINNQYVLQDDISSLFNTSTKYKEGR